MIEAVGAENRSELFRMGLIVIQIMYSPYLTVGEALREKDDSEMCFAESLRTIPELLEIINSKGVKGGIL